jgi:hypothetical protein
VSPAVTDRIDACWFAGMTIGGTIISLRRSMGAHPDFEQIRLRFVDLADFMVLGIPLPSPSNDCTPACVHVSMKA